MGWQAGALALQSVIQMSEDIGEKSEIRDQRSEASERRREGRPDYVTTDNRTAGAEDESHGSEIRALGRMK